MEVDEKEVGGRGRRNWISVDSHTSISLTKGQSVISFTLNYYKRHYARVILWRLNLEPPPGLKNPAYPPQHHRTMTRYFKRVPTIMLQT